MLVRSVRDANRSSSQLAREVEKGQIVVITMNGKQVAEVRPEIEDGMQDPIWPAAYERIVKMLGKKPDYGIEVGEITEEDKYGDAPP